MDFKIFTLQNGLRVVHVPRMGTGTVALSMCGDVGSIHEKENETGAAHFLEHVVLEGTQKFPSPEKSTNRIAEVGGRRGATTDNTTTEYRTSVLKEDSERGLEFLSQVLIHPLIPQESVERNKKIILQEIRQVLANPRRKSMETLVELLYQNHRLGVSVAGTPEHIEKMDRGIIVEFWKKHYRPERFVLSVCGDIDETKLLKLTQKYFGDWKNGAKEPGAVVSPGRQDGTSVATKLGGEPGQTVLAVGHYGYTADDQKKYAAFLLSKILGEGEMSRLFMSMRIGTAHAYYTSAASRSSKYHGMFFITTAVAAERTDEVLHSIGRELHRAASEAPSASEISRVKKRLAAMDLFNMESTVNTAFYYSKLFTEQPNSGGYTEELVKFQTVSAKDIQNVAKEIFSQKPKVAVVGQSLTRNDIDIRSLEL
ncbi:insulinase family protein [Candidatus Wolfebacteria bacterium]|nr:insulinase family protein [Candidatus Wolfebacteria bacterium]